jgi:hypothetical protein
MKLINNIKEVEFKFRIYTLPHPDDEFDKDFQLLYNDQILLTFDKYNNINLYKKSLQDCFNFIKFNCETLYLIYNNMFYINIDLNNDEIEIGYYIYDHKK